MSQPAVPCTAAAQRLRRPRPFLPKPRRSGHFSIFSNLVWFVAIPHNSKCRYGERGAAAAKPKAQIILCVLSSILATQMPCRSRRSGA